MAALKPCMERVQRRDGSWGPCGVLSPEGRCPDHRRKRDHRRLEKNPFRWLYKDPRWSKVKAEVVARDGYRCTWTVGTRRCNTQALLEVHHEEKLRHIWERCGSPQRGAPGWDHFVREACDARHLRTLCHAHHKHVDNNDPREAKLTPDVQATSQHRRNIRDSKRRRSRKRGRPIGKTVRRRTYEEEE